MTRITKTNFKKAAKNSGGNQARIAEKLEVTRAAVNQFIKRHPELRQIIDDEAEYVLDIAEDCIDTDILIRKDVKTARWKLMNSKSGRARGYGQRQEVAIEEHLATTSLTKEERQAEIKRLLGK